MIPGVFHCLLGCIEGRNASVVVVVPIQTAVTIGRRPMRDLGRFMFVLDALVLVHSGSIILRIVFIGFVDFVSYLWLVIHTVEWKVVEE